MEIQHFSHDHPLVFKKEPSIGAGGEEERHFWCFGCAELVDGPSYICNDCKFFLHQNCAELELPPQITHVFHPQHPLVLLPKSPYSGGSYKCDYCGKQVFMGFVYHCALCEFDLDINCALLEASFAENFLDFLHDYTWILVQNHNKEHKYNCAGCVKPISGPTYFYLYSGRTRLYLHKECCELPLKINHPYDRLHPLTLLPIPSIHPQKCCCYLCKINWGGFVYCCSVCNIELTPEDVSAARSITAASHQHPWMLLSSQISFICDFCGTEGDRTPYFCTTCDLLVHKDCISLPSRITITRHHHLLSHSYTLHQDQSECRICPDIVNTRYGSYNCSDCNYIAHVHCATNEDIWDEKITLQDEDEEESMNWITEVIEEINTGENMVAVIKHAYHDHKLILTLTSELQDDNNCDGCMGSISISTPFYSCDQCKFFLHKTCAELPRKKRSPSHKHALTLTYNKDQLEFCTACGRYHHGFSYQCHQLGCFLGIDIHCSLLSETLRHPSHEHPLYLVHNYRGKCNGCQKAKFFEVSYRCLKGCDFALDFKCATLPLTAWYKYDKHPLALTYFEDSSPSQHYCDLCEKDRNPNHWFYYCTHCDNSLHINCAIGDLPLVKLGSTFLRHPHPSRFSLHVEPLTFVKNIWNCPRCDKCSELCYGQALKCTESECNLNVHWRCGDDVYDL